MTERFKVPVLKTGDPKGSVGSNPTRSDPYKEVFMAKKTKEQFEKDECKRLNINPNDLPKFSLEIMACDCRYKDCPGWNWEPKERKVS